MHEGYASEDEKPSETARRNSACSHYGVNTNGDMKGSIYEQQLRHWQALGEISAALPRAAIWRNKDHDTPTSVIGIYDEPGADGRLYIRTSDGAGGVPFDELEFLPSDAVTTRDHLTDALIEDMEGF